MNWSEDKLSIVTGGGILLLAFLAYMAIPLGSFSSEKSRLLETIDAQENLDLPFISITQKESTDQLKSLKGQTNILQTFFDHLKIKPRKWSSNPIVSFSFKENEENKRINSMLVAREAKAKKDAMGLQNLVRANNFAVQEDINNAEAATSKWILTKEDLVTYSVKSDVTLLKTVGSLAAMFGFLALIFGVVERSKKQNVIVFIKAFAVLFGLGLLSYLLSAQANFKDIGLGYALWAIVIGIFISNVLGIPKWLEAALQHELYIKTGLVLLGAEILFGKILAIGLPGIFVAWFVTPVVLVSTFWFGQRILKIGSKTLNMTISADMSVCGVSAAIATAAACGAKKEELTTAIGMSMMFTSIMMVAMPAFINYMEMPEVLGGAWLGGTIDATGAVVAAGAFLGEKALSVAATIKMIQNILIGVVAFFVAVYWTTKVEKSESQSKIGWGEIWKRFPKFIIGFIGASLLFSALHAGFDAQTSSVLLEKGVLGFSKTVRGWLFCLAFVSIGLSTNFKVLKQQFSGGKPLILYLVGQTFNLCLTLLVAYIVFYKIFPDITAGI